ncbi:carbamoyltransferase C-terminal domain-containing protein [Streptomyces sp. NPDC048665]|uniref:carbamoyltransferase C-terminal domain-containing protein n=1 Tax=Streptomyces sp. NPDC048665 TaxID=3155490 RepID=UPI00343AD363
MRPPGGRSWPGTSRAGWCPRRSPIGHRREPIKRFSAFLGAHPSKEEATTALEDFGLTSYGRPAEVTDVALLLSQDRIVCWYTGRSEWGPRALGARSILADPTSPGSVARLNSRVKFREPFRPFGVSVDEDAAAELFDLEFQRGCCTIGQVNLSPKPAADPSPSRLTGDGRRATGRISPPRVCVGEAGRGWRDRSPSA